uniref:Uncharacterized protein n=1 Tax=Amblyomma cajennense TaxID=34607 RepID=A0A023FBY6_AMBCJ
MFYAFLHIEVIAMGVSRTTGCFLGSEFCTFCLHISYAHRLIFKGHFSHFGHAVHILSVREEWVFFLFHLMCCTVLLFLHKFHVCSWYGNLLQLAMLLSSSVNAQTFDRCVFWHGCYCVEADRTLVPVVPKMCMR